MNEPPTVTVVERPRATNDHVASGEDRAVLDAIRCEAINLAIWARGFAPPLPAAHCWAEIDDIGLTAPVRDLDVALRRALDDAGYPAACVAGLAVDVTALAGSVARIADCDRVSVRLEIVETDACRRFHADHVTVRLITTYAGRGTQWLADGDADALRRGADPADLPIRSLVPGDVALFKGLRWSPDRAIVHRSPPIAATGEQRVVLVFDPAPAEPVMAASP